ncbi:MAG: ATP-binding protein [Chitinophagia bacterium]|nr:ATP-binding protein [Chitinophagia bacterium]
MILSNNQKEKIINELLAQRERFTGSDAQFAKQYNIAGAIFSRVKNGERTGIIGDDKLIQIGRKLGVGFGEQENWVIVETQTMQYITTQLAYCRENSEARILVDIAGIGKTTAAKYFMRTEQNVFYVDCSQVKTKREFIRELARTIGVDHTGKLADITRDTIYSLSIIERPIVILDEAGDLNYEAWLEIKRLWNASEGACGWYMMGADGLKAKIESHLRSRKVGYAEIFDRFGHRFNTTLPENGTEIAQYLRAEAELIAQANLKDTSLIPELLRDSMPQKGEYQGFRRLRANILKKNRQL